MRGKEQNASRNPSWECLKGRFKVRRRREGKKQMALLLRTKEEKGVKTLGEAKGEVIEITPHSGRESSNRAP